MEPRPREERQNAAAHSTEAEWQRLTRPAASAFSSARSPLRQSSIARFLGEEAPAELEEADAG
eukprot:472290-Prymnesium_polylepis.1